MILQFIIEQFHVLLGIDDDVSNEFSGYSINVEPGLSLDIPNLHILPPNIVQHQGNYKSAQQEIIQNLIFETWFGPMSHMTNTPELFQT